MQSILLLVSLLCMASSALALPLSSSKATKHAAIKPVPKNVSSNKMESDLWLKRGLDYKNGTSGIRVDKYKASAWIRMAAAIGNKSAQLEMEKLYKHGMGVPKDLNKAMYWCKKAEANHQYKGGAGHHKHFAAAHSLTFKSSVQMADSYFSGRGSPRNLEEAYKWYLKAAQEGNSYAAYMLSVMYQLGRGVEQSLNQSVHWYKVGSSHKDALLSRMRVAANFEIGYGLPMDLVEAAKWYERVAVYKVAKAQNALGDLYNRNATEVQDYKAAFKWYYLAAQQNYALGQYNLALMYLDGKGIKKSPRKAAYWFKQAAYRKVRPAQYELGKMYFDGLGVQQNDIRAYAWLDIALRDQNDATPEMMDILINDMEPKTREMALELTKRYETKYMFKK